MPVALCVLVFSPLSMMRGLGLDRTRWRHRHAGQLHGTALSSSVRLKYVLFDTPLISSVIINICSCVVPCSLVLIPKHVDHCSPFTLWLEGHTEVEQSYCHVIWTHIVTMTRAVVIINILFDCLLTP